MSSWIVGIDTGGTFTDLAAVAEESGRMVVTKVPSTPANPAEGVLAALRAFAAECGVPLDQVSFLAHGTTVATNAVLEGKGTATGLIITAGFRAVYEVRGGTRPPVPERLNPRYQKPRPLIPLSSTFPVRERIASDGSVLVPLDEDAVRAAAAGLKAQGLRSVAVCLLFSFMNPAHEERIAEILRAEYPELRVSLSSRVLPVIREYPRLSTTVLDAYVGPVIQQYLHHLSAQVRAAGLRTQQFYVMQSNGGLMRINLAAQYPNETLLSGPAAGVVFATRLGQRCGEEHLLTLDMGGTSTDMSVIRSGQFAQTRQGEIAGQSVGTPMIEIETLGAGGGTVAWIGKDDLLKVGPRSAGADPGPACYGRGGTEPTVTDANVLLGYLDARRLLGGKMVGDPDLSRAALARVGARLGLDAVAAAVGVNRIVNTHMAVGLRITLTDKGCDPAAFALVAFGGSGPVHAWRLAEEVRIPRVIVPPYPGIGCATGLLYTDIVHQYPQSFMVSLAQAPLDEVNGRFRALVERAHADSQVEGFAPEQVEIFREMDLRYPHQGYELAVECPNRDLAEADRAWLRAAFDRRHEQVYSVSAPEERVEVVNLRVRSVVTRPPLPDQPAAAAGESAAAAHIGSRPAFFGSGFVATTVYARAMLSPGNLIAGPAIIEQLDSTTVVGPDWQARVDPFRNLVLVRKEGAHGR